MQKTINSEALLAALSQHGLTQRELAEQIGVSSQAVTNWVKGKDFPRPPKLLKLSTVLRLGFDQLVDTVDEGRPIVAFRKKANAKTTELHTSQAVAVGKLLKPLVAFLPDIQALRTLITSPSTEYLKLEHAVVQTRARLGIGSQAVLGYEHIIREFKTSGAVLVPVMWGSKGKHENALHIRLPKEDVTFVFLNLDTRLEDFNFGWRTNWRMSTRPILPVPTKEKISQTRSPRRCFSRGSARKLRITTLRRSALQRTC